MLDDATAAESAYRLSVVLCLGTAGYQARLPQVLLQHRLLRRLFRLGPELEAYDPDGISLRRVGHFPAYQLAARLLWGCWRRMPGTGRSKLPHVAVSRIADRLIAGRIPSASVFHGITGACLLSLQVAQRHGACALIESPLQNSVSWQREVLAECKRFGIDARRCDAVLPDALVKRMLHEYERADAVIVNSSQALGGFDQLGFGRKARMVLPGVDHEFFSPAQVLPERFRAAYVGRVELAKGVPYLLEAWSRLKLRNAELWLIGEVRPEMVPILRKYASASIKVCGLLPASELRSFYRRCGCLVMPSVNEGLATVILEAMSCGKPVLATENSGAQDCIKPGENGFIVASRNVTDLAECLAWFYSHPDEAHNMGLAARRAVLGGFTQEHYAERIIAVYRDMAGC